MGGSSSDNLAALQQQLTHQASSLLLMSLVMTAVGTPLLILLHELGHALMARRRGLPVDLVRIGGTPFWSFELMGFRVEVGPWLGWRERIFAPRPPAGIARFDVPRDPVDLLLIALAGPAASLGAGLCALFATRLVAPAGDLHLLLILVTWSGVTGCLWNLVPRTTRTGPTDGQLALLALRTMRAATPISRPATPLAAPDPRAATSVPPPGQAPASRLVT